MHTCENLKSDRNVLILKKIWEYHKLTRIQNGEKKKQTDFLFWGVTLFLEKCHCSTEEQVLGTERINRRFSGR